MRLLVLLLLLVAGSASAQTAQEIVAKADRIRNPGQAFRSTVTLTEYVNGGERDRTMLAVFSKEDPVTHQFRNLVQYVEPPRDTGKRVLLDGRSLWFYDPASKASVRISAQQRLVGQASIGDILTVNLAADYTASVLGSETIDDAARQKRTCWHLDLKAASDQSTYNRVEYWVDQANFQPVKLRVYSDSGRVLKVLYYRDFAERLGALRPAEAVIIDAVDTNLVTTARQSGDQFQDVPDAWFQRDYLPRLQLK
ncbi:outer membrane lipoprotein-sorting protein [Roseiterribacter gracilis]|uniref:Outer membrane lipoprotein-sorting protein n=1 Tax=Roseiterribacter gracilis TaxID=2812848 RepID=A0A8S8XJ62_9PROT|nr:outer membrane lipoprotein-sorting protein [Rhodospirillales bacterium TMPK1]